MVAAPSALAPSAQGAAPAIPRLELRVERLKATYRFTYAFHAREVRFECDAGEGFQEGQLQAPIGAVLDQQQAVAAVLLGVLGVPVVNPAWNRSV